MRASVPPLFVLSIGCVASAFAGGLGCSAKSAGASGKIDGGGGTDAGAPGVTPPPPGDGSCDLGVPLVPEGCIGADAGVETITSDGKPAIFSFAAPDPATGDWQTSDGSTAAQVFYSPAANAWEANLLHGFDQANPTPIATLQGTPTSCTSMTFSGGGWTGTLDGAHLSLGDGTQMLDLQRTVRPSPTLCAPPPAGGVLLFDGTNFDQWGTIAGKDWLHTSGPPMWTLVDGGAGGAMEVRPNTASIITQQTFGACTIHAEFRTLGTPTHSGVFPEARYQVTILQTYGLLTGNISGDLGNENPVVNPTVHAERPPLMWQTLDIDFTPPGGEGGAGSPSVTVRLNGVTLFENTALTPPTGAASSMPPAPTGPILLEYHGMPLQYRNIWVVPSP